MTKLIAFILSFLFLFYSLIFFSKRAKSRESSSIKYFLLMGNQCWLIFILHAYKFYLRTDEKGREKNEFAMLSIIFITIYIFLLRINTTKNGCCICVHASFCNKKLFTFLCVKKISFLK